MKRFKLKNMGDNKPKANQLKSYIGGFTLVEIIVSISIFTVVMLITMGALLTLNDSSRKAQALRTVIDNLNFAIEDMNRKIRTGDVYHCFDKSTDVTTTVPDSGRDCPGSGGQALSLKTQEVVGTSGSRENIWSVYLFEKDPVTGAGGIRLRSSLPSGGRNIVPKSDELSITAPEVDIRTMEFRVVGSTGRQGGQAVQPMVIINVSGVVDLQKEKLRTDFSLQTAISRRSVDSK